MFKVLKDGQINETIFAIFFRNGKYELNVITTVSFIDETGKSEEVDHEYHVGTFDTIDEAYKAINIIRDSIFEASKNAIETTIKAID